MTSSTPYRVLLMNLPPLLAEVVAASLALDPAIELTQIAPTTTAGLAHIQPDTDVVILGVNDVHAPPDLCFHLLTHRPTLKLLLLNADSGEGASLYLTPVYQAMPAMSAVELPTLLRQLAEVDSYDLSEGRQKN